MIFTEDPSLDSQRIKRFGLEISELELHRMVPHDLAQRVVEILSHHIERDLHEWLCSKEYQIELKQAVMDEVRKRVAATVAQNIDDFVDEILS
jgi:hypothetical protein